MTDTEAQANLTLLDAETKAALLAYAKQGEPPELPALQMNVTLTVEKPDGTSASFRD